MRVSRRAPGASDRRPASGVRTTWLLLLVIALSSAATACSAVRVRSDSLRTAAPASSESLATLATDARRAYAELRFPTAGSSTELRAAALADYNRATERLAELLFEQRGERAPRGADAEVVAQGFTFRRVGDARGHLVPRELVPASRLRVAGIRNVHRRRGIGAPFVAVLGDDAANNGAAVIESPFVAATVVLGFAGTTRAEILASRDAAFIVYDPRRTAAIRIGDCDFTLAADYTAPYALWLARSRFERQARSALIRRTAPLAEPRVYALEPYDPSRRTVVLLHGLGGSPATWVDVVNELLADAELHARYQVWQVFYPTNLPLPEARKTVREALLAALAAVDPEGDDRATAQLTLIGHSMGGVVARLLVVESGDVLWQEVFKARIATLERERVAELAPYLTLEPLPQVATAVFLAAPHRGSPLAAHWRGKLAALFVRLPARTLRSIASLTANVVANGSREAPQLQKRPTSVTTLGDDNPYLRVTATLPIAASVTYHTIVGRHDASEPVAGSSDGVVPYSSAHLDGAASELVVDARHALQNLPEVVGEIRRILRETRS